MLGCYNDDLLWIADEPCLRCFKEAILGIDGGNDDLSETNINSEIRGCLGELQLNLTTYSDIFFRSICRIVRNWYWFVGEKSDESDKVPQITIEADYPQWQDFTSLRVSASARTCSRGETHRLAGDPM